MATISSGLSSAIVGLSDLFSKRDWPLVQIVILALYSIVTLTARQLVPRDSLVTRDAAWYAKDSPTFSGMVVLVRRSLWCEAI
jgi:hypothetical protein